MRFCSPKVFYFFCIEQTTFILYHEKILSCCHPAVFFDCIMVAIVYAAKSDRCKKNDRTAAHFSPCG